MGRPPAITRAQRLRRVCIISTNFARNLAYYRASRSNGDRLLPERNFWVNLEGNCIDIAVLEWCKLFAENGGRHSWRRVVTNSEDFEAALLEAIGKTQEQFEQIILEVKTYRDRFIAHLDNDQTMQIPLFDPLLDSTRFYFSHIVTAEMTDEDRRLAGLENLDGYYQQCYDEASAIYTVHPREVN